MTGQSLPAAGRWQGGRPGWRLARRISLIAAVVLLAAGTAAALEATRAGPPARPAPPARPFTLARLGTPGGQVSLRAYAGRPVVVNFFASWCGPCKRETPLLARFYRAHRGTIAVIGIASSDPPAAALRFVHQDGVSYPVGSDTSGAVATPYGVVALPQTFFLNAEHRIVRHVFGDVTLAELRSWASGTARSGGRG